MDEVNIRPPMDEDDLAWLRDLWKHEWGGDTMISRGKVHRLEDLESIVAWINGARVGVATYRIGPDDCELLSLNSTVQGKGIGSVLSSAVEQAARMAGKQRVWLITSNDNLDALQFYQRRGYRIVAVYPGAVDEARKVKPSIPFVGYYDIPICDELELEKMMI